MISRIFSSLLESETTKRGRKGGGKKRRTRLSFVHVPIDVKNNPNKNSVGEERLSTGGKKTATGGKFLGKVSAILYLVSRFIPRLMLDRDKMERARWPSLEFPGQKAQVGPMQTNPYIPSSPFRWFSFSSFPVTNNVNPACVITSVHAGFLSRHGFWMGERRQGLMKICTALGWNVELN